MNQTLYEVLGVERTASEDEIKAAYREQAMRWHPDKNHGEKAAEERFKAISHAYSIVGNAESRRAYDAQMAGGIHTEQAFQSGPSTQQAAEMFFSAMLTLAFELTARNVALSEISRELVSRGCPDAVAYEIASRVEAERKRSIRSFVGDLLRRSLLWILGGGAFITIFGDVGVIRVAGALMIVRGVWDAARAIYRVSTGRAPLDREPRARRACGDARDAANMHPQVQKVLVSPTEVGTPRTRRHPIPRKDHGDPRTTRKA